MSFKDFTYGLSSEVHAKLCVRIYSEESATVVLFNKKKPLTLPLYTRGDEWIHFPVRISELPLETEIAINFLDKVFRVEVFDQGVLKSGLYNLLSEPRVDEILRMKKRYERGDFKRSWIDQHSLILLDEELTKFDTIFIEFVKLEIPIIYSEIPGAQGDDENLVELKHRRLNRSHRTGFLDRELKPNAKLRDELNRICLYPPTHSLTREESDLVWKFRFYLTRNKQALTKFLKSVDWGVEVEIKQATELLLPLWVDIQLDDALELLGKQFKNAKVRDFAVKQLEKAADDDLLLYLLQLVQAIKYEQLEKGVFQSPLVELLTRKAVENNSVGNYFYWYLMSELDDSKIYGKVAYYYMRKLEELDRQRRDVLRRQAELVESLTQLCKSLQASKDSRVRKIQRLKEMIDDPKLRLSEFDPLPLPLDPTVTVKGINPENCFVFKSNMLPLKLSFITTSNEEYELICKVGDDLRQDQLIMQVINLMDRLLLKENLDLRLTPYKILSTGSNCGLIQFIQAQPLATILSKTTLQQFIGSEEGSMDNYIKSCAGYCVITYLLGIGDRHLDNLLLAKNGCLFHIDFGYILGRDPKPFPPPMKLCKEMVDCMGGFNSDRFREFRSLCHTAFLILRKSANLILNLFTLMTDASIPDIQMAPDEAVLKVQEKFRLDLSDEEAIQVFDRLMNESVNALFPQLMETVHKWAQYWRK